MGSQSIAGTGLDTELMTSEALGPQSLIPAMIRRPLLRLAISMRQKLEFFAIAAGVEQAYRGHLFRTITLKRAVAGPVGKVATIISDDVSTGFYAKDNRGSIGGIFLANDSPFDFDTNTAPSVCEFSTYDPNLPGVRFMSAAQWDSYYTINLGFNDNESVAISRQQCFGGQP